MIARQDAIETLKRFWRTEDFKFFGEFYRPKNENGYLIKPRSGEQPYGFIRNLSSNDRKILYPRLDGYTYDRRVSFKVNLADGLIDGKYYYVEVELDDDENRNENPYLLKIKNIYILEDDYLSPKEFIKEWFYRKGHTPGDASTIARQLKLNELELYTHTKRFIFELIQNADDMPSGNRSVDIEIYLLKNFLLFLHNGKFFDREDVKAISDAAKSTKDKSVRQIGYKGIGFKSVFTDSVRVYIRSADYSFKFDKYHPIYDNFWELYKGYTDKLTETEKRKFEIEYKDQVLNYTNIDRIPWQIKPIWVERHEYPEELTISQFFDRSHQVAIALEIGESTIRQKNYDNMIHGLLLEPRFMLFLRNTRGFIYHSYDSTGDIENLNISLKNNYGKFDVVEGDKTLSTYLKNEFAVKITNDDFIRSGLNFQKRELEGGKIEFFDSDGRRVENIPEKLGMLDSTVISLGAKVSGNNILKLSKEESVLFNYLPTSDQRFGFPFLVNGDFVTKTDREFIQVENSWNHYLFYNIGFLCIEWLASLGKATHEINGKDLFTFGRSYLNLLPESFLDENNEELGAINKSFNNGLRDAISTIRFIIDCYGNLKSASEIILDETGISMHLGVSFFKSLSGNTKVLPHWILESNCLRYGYLQIEKYTIEDLIYNLALEENKTLLAAEIEKLSESKYKELLSWFDTLCKEPGISTDLINKLPIILVNNKAFSILAILSDQALHIKTQKVKEIESILSSIGYTLSEIYLDDYQNIFDRLRSAENYLAKDIILYEKIAGNSSLGHLTALQKVNLVKFFESLDGVGDTKYAKTLPLFNSKVKTFSLRPLNQLISNRCEYQPKWLQPFFILEEEEGLLPSALSKNLIKPESIFSRILCNIESYNQIIKAINPNELDEFYKFIIQAYNDKLNTDIPNYTVIPWIYSDKTDGFLSSESFFWHDSLVDLENTEYSFVKSVLESCSELAIPNQSSRPLIKLFSLSCTREPLNKVLKKSSSFDKATINSFLAWIENISDKEFFKHFNIIVASDNKYCITPSKGFLQYYTDDNDLIAFITKNSAINQIIKLLPSELFNKKLKNIGLLVGSDLLTYLIDNGLASKELIKFLTPELPLGIKEYYIENLHDLDLSSEVFYNKETLEHKIIDLVTNLGEIKGKDIVYGQFIGKIRINSLPISEKNISDDVIFKMPKADNGISYYLKLSDIFDDHNDQTAIVTKVAHSFEGYNQEELKDLLFKLREEAHSKILQRINLQESEYYSPMQLLFLFLYKEENGIKETIGKKPTFYKYLYEKDNDLYRKKVLEFLDICLQHNYTNFSFKTDLIELPLRNLISSNNVSIDSEHLPIWVEEWMNQGDTKKRKTFLIDAGLNGDASYIYNLRTSLLVDDFEAFNKCLVNLDNIKLIANTIHWLDIKQKRDGLILCNRYLRPIFEKLSLNKVSISDLLVPIRLNPNSEGIWYSLIKHDPQYIYHEINSQWGEYSSDVINHITESGEFIIDDSLPIYYNKEIRRCKYSIRIDLDRTAIETNSYDFNEPYYLGWQHKILYIIKIFRGLKLPKQLVFDGKSIKSLTLDNVHKEDKTIFVTENQIDEIPYNLREFLPDKIKLDLIDQKRNYEKKAKKNDVSVLYSDEEVNSLKQLFRDNIPKEFFEDLNLAALIKGLIYLKQKGYYVSKAEENLATTHGSAQLHPVYAPGTNDESGTPLTVKCRSAKSGLLYLRASTWNELIKSNVYMYVLTGNDLNECRFCKSREELINDSKADYQIIRIEATSKPENIDSILKGEFDWKSIWIVIRMKNNSAYRSIFEKIGEKQRSDQIDDIKVGNESED